MAIRMQYAAVKATARTAGGGGGQLGHLHSGSLRHTRGQAAQHIPASWLQGLGLSLRTRAPIGRSGASTAARLCVHLRDRAPLPRSAYACAR